MPKSDWKPSLPPHPEYKKNTFQKAARVVDFVYQIGDSEILRQPSHPVNIKAITSAEIQAKIAYLSACLVKYRELMGMGRAISMCQVGDPAMIMAVWLPDTKTVKTLINPLITLGSEKLLKYPEICMSANPIIVPTIRPAWIEFEYYDELGKKQFWNTKDDTDQGRVLNRVFQHEIDHMEGYVNVDRVKAPDKIFFDVNPAFYETAQFEDV